MEFHFEKLAVWQEAMSLVTKVYKVSDTMPQEERFGLIGQLRRAALSIPANIVEGRGRYHTKAFVQFLFVARGSLYETITLIKAATLLELVKPGDQETLLMQCQLVNSKLSGLINALK